MQIIDDGDEQTEAKWTNNIEMKTHKRNEGRYSTFYYSVHT